MIRYVEMFRSEIAICFKKIQRFFSWWEVSELSIEWGF
jgi:hypothetical protein